MVRFLTQTTRVISAHKKRLSFRPIFTWFCSPEANFHWEGRVFCFEKNVFSCDICNVLSVQPLGMLLFVSKQCRVPDEVHELFGTMGAVLRKSLPGQLSELRQLVVPGVPMPLTENS